MATKKFYCNPTSTACLTELISGIILGIIAIVSIVFLLSDSLMWHYGYIFGDYDTAVMILIPTFCFSTFMCIFGIIRYIRVTKTPMVELDDAGIGIKNANTGNILHCSFNDIDRVELSEVRLLGKRFRCINIIPTKGAYERILPQCRKKDIALVERLYRDYGAVAQIFEHLLEQDINSVYKTIDETISTHKNK